MKEHGFEITVTLSDGADSNRERKTVTVRIGQTGAVLRKIHDFSLNVGEDSSVSLALGGDSSVQFELRNALIPKSLLRFTQAAAAAPAEDVYVVALTSFCKVE